MAITEKSTKVLWGRSGGCCAICRMQLVLPREVAADDHSVVGEMAHIVAQSAGGPRGVAEFPGNLDHHSNLILLCRTHHKIVDDQTNGWNVERLRKQKADHEAWVTQTLGFEPVQIRPDPEGPNPNKVLFFMVQSGHELWGQVCSAWSHRFNYSERHRSDEEVEKLMELFDELRDWMDIAESIDTMRGQRDGRKRMQEILEESIEIGYILYSRRFQMLVTGGIEPAPMKYWHVEIQAVPTEDFFAMVTDHLKQDGERAADTGEKP